MGSSFRKKRGVTATNAIRFDVEDADFVHTAGRAAATALQPTGVDGLELGDLLVDARVDLEQPLFDGPGFSQGATRRPGPGAENCAEAASAGLLGEKTIMPRSRGLRFRSQTSNSDDRISTRQSIDDFSDPEARGADLAPHTRPLMGPKPRSPS